MKKLRRSPCSLHSRLENDVKSSISQKCAGMVGLCMHGHISFCTCVEH